jgi:hypothetical protein
MQHWGKGRVEGAQGIKQFGCTILVVVIVIAIGGCHHWWLLLSSSLSASSKTGLQKQNKKVRWE